ncbi:MAG: HlyD family efflux transporter periplasmic adaptor subunit [Vicinamibacterales bacterium]
MDLQRDPSILRRKKRRQLMGAAAAGIIVIVLSVAVSKLEPASPTVVESTLWPGVVKRGPMVREVRGTGTLVPEEIRWIPASTSGRVETVVLHPGADVQPGTVILELSNSDLQQSVKNAELDWQTAVAQVANQRATLANNRLTQESAAVDAEALYQIGLSDLEVNENLAKEGLVAAFTVRQKQVAVTQAKNRLELVRKQIASAAENAASQLAPAEATVNQRRSEFDRLSRQLADLHVRSTMSGRLQLINVEVGQQIGAGTNLARVSDPGRLKAELRISETQTKDLRANQRVDVDTRNGHVPGHVSRIDPASKGGTVGVDVILDGPLPAGARPDLSVDGTIELERLADVLFVESPAVGQEQSTISLFKVVPGKRAVRTPVKIGRRSVLFVEVLDGLKEGDRVILSDMSQYDGFDTLTLN